MFVNFFKTKKNWPLLATLLGIFSFISASPALAHVKWTVDVHKIEATPKDPLFSQITPVNLTLGLVTLILLGVLVALSVYLKNNPKTQAFIAKSLTLKPYVSTVLSITLGIALIASGLGKDFFAPELPLSKAFSWLSSAQIILGAMLILGLFTRLSAALVLLLYVVGVFIYQVGMIDYLDLIGVCLYLIIRGRGAFGLDNIISQQPWSAKFLRLDAFDQYAMGILRIATGITLIWLGVDKWWHPDWSFAVITSHNLPTFGFSKEMFVFGAGLVETAVGVGVLAGAVIRIIAVILAILFSVTAMVFAGEIIGHIVLFGVVFAMLIEGAGAWEIANAFKPSSKYKIRTAALSRG